ncbi:hypothetical protein [Streptomyces sp. cg35]|uniref:hypothetical protein n=1 Tax=Streptomyces sp. cg35 TaxID=3421650 RepID=UPI003D17CB6B
MMRATSRMPRMVTLGAAGLLATGVLAGCGSSDGEGKDSAGPTAESREQSPTQVVQATNEKTSQAGSARVKLTSTASSGGRSETVRGAGVMDFEDGASRIELGRAGQRIEQRVVDQALYQRPTKGTGELPDGKSWMKIDLERLRDSGVSGGAQVSDPSDSFAYSKSLSEKDVKKVGSEQVGGVRTTHYRVVVDIDKLAKGSADQSKKLREQLGDTLPMDLWIDDKGLTRRQQIELTTQGKSSGGTPKGSATKAKVVMDFSDFGTDVDVDAPAAADTVDMTSKVIKQSKQNA